MLTPAFQLQQDEIFLTIIIKAPFAKVSETEIFVEDNDFKFFSKPYFLRLTLPGNLVEDGREKADYNADKGEFHIVFAKQNQGEHFEGLDMITKLLAPQGKRSAVGPLIQVIGDESVDGQCVEVEQDEACIQADAQCLEADEDFDWCIEQTPYVEQPTLLTAPKYGFANQKSGVFQRLQEDMVGIIDCPEPDTMTVADRRTHRLSAEHSKFDEDHYLGDLYEDEVIQTLIEYEPPWIQEYKQLSSGTPSETAVILTVEEQEVMRKLPRKQYLLEAHEETCVYLGLVDLLYTYVYNHRTTLGENNCESGWTVCKTSATLSWLEVYNSLHDVLVGCYRRSLCYPLYRHWKLNQLCLHDVTIIFKLGVRRILKCLIELRSLLLDEESRYVLNDLYITDYCVWIQSASKKWIQSLALALEKVELCKADVGFDLLEIERLAEVAMQDETDHQIDDVTTQLHTVSLHHTASYTHTDDVITDTADVITDSDDATTDSDDVVTDSDDCTTDSDESDDIIRENSDITSDINAVKLENDLTDDSSYNARKKVNNEFLEQKLQNQNTDHEFNLTDNISSFITGNKPGVLKVVNEAETCDDCDAQAGDGGAVAREVDSADMDMKPTCKGQVMIEVIASTDNT